TLLVTLLGRVSLALAPSVLAVKRELAAK
ncbi:MAG: hypothetical protein ACJA2J_002284, partial [Candidatus Azotimanducaceae bacterium]